MSQEDENGMSKPLKGISTFINRVGFPVFAFIVLAYFHYVKLEENTKALNDLRDVMVAVKTTMERIAR